MPCVVRIFEISLLPKLNFHPNTYSLMLYSFALPFLLRVKEKGSELARVDMFCNKDKHLRVKFKLTGHLVPELMNAI